MPSLPPGVVADIRTENLKPLTWGTVCVVRTCSTPKLCGTCTQTDPRTVHEGPESWKF